MRLTTLDFGVNRLRSVESENATGEYVTLAEAKLWLRVDGDDEDSLIQGLIDDAVAEAERILNRSLIEKRYTAIWATFSAEVPLPFTPVSEIISVERINKGELEEITDFYSIADALRFEKTYGYESPYYQQGLKVVYDAGVSDVGVKSAVKQMILTNYEDRQDNADNIMEIPSNSRKKLLRFKRYVN